jgi:hypothetical protein
MSELSRDTASTYLFATVEPHDPATDWAVRLHFIVIALLVLSLCGLFLA